MLEDTPYNVLKQKEHAYEIMLLHDLQSIPFADIAKKFKISAAAAKDTYNRMKLKQIHLYINHIASALGHKNILKIQKIYNNACEYYQDHTYVCAYLEKKYKDILTKYRNGEPGMPEEFIKNMPPFKPNLSKETVAGVIKLRETKKASFSAIANELNITTAKAKRIYETFYHEKVLEIVNLLQENAKTKEEKDAIWNYCFDKYYSSKKRYDMLIKTLLEIMSKTGVETQDIK